MMVYRLVFAGAVLLLLYFIRNRYSKGLNKFDGPFLASFTDLWKVWYAYNSSQRQIYVDIHQKYGDVVRIGPNNLSFADPQAIHDIYGTKGAPQKVSSMVASLYTMLKRPLWAVSCVLIIHNMHSLKCTIRPPCLETVSDPSACYQPPTGDGTTSNVD